MNLLLSAGAAIFAGLVGTGVLDIGTSTHVVSGFDHAAIAVWAVALLLLAAYAYLPAPRRFPLGLLAGVATAVAGALTATVLFVTGFGFSRDHDRVRLVLTGQAVTALRSFCGPNVRPDRIDGRIRTRTLQEEFVIFDFDRSLNTSCSRHSVDIPRGAVVAIQEDPPS